MERSQLLAHLHDLRVLVASIRMASDEVLGDPSALQGVAWQLADQLDLLSEVLRAWIDTEQETDNRVGLHDLRALAWLARARHPELLTGEMPMPLAVPAAVRSMLELLELLVQWTAGGHGRARIDATAAPEGSALRISALPPWGEGAGADRELEQAITTLAEAVRVEVVLDQEERSAELRVGYGDCPDDDAR